MDNSHLTPEPRTDKNGVTSTRWLRPQGHRNAAMVHMLPAPEQPNTASTKQLTRDLVNEMRQLGMSISEETTGRRALYTILSNDAELMNRIMKRIRDASPLERSVWDAHFTRNISPFEATKNWDKDHIDYDRLLSNMKLLPLFVERGETPSETLSSLLKKTRIMEQISDIPVGDENYTKVQASLIIGCIDPFPVSLRGRDEDIEFIADNIDAVIPLIPLLKDRQSTDRGLIAALLTNDTPVLNEGVL